MTSCVRQTPVYKTLVNTGSNCDAAINTLIGALNDQLSTQADNAYDKCVAQEKLNQWANRQGPWKDPFEGSTFPLDGQYNTGKYCSKGNPENNLDAKQRCVTYAKAAGVPYWEDYST